MLGLLGQVQGPDTRVVAYLSKQLDTIVRSWLAYLRALAVAALLNLENQKLIFRQPIMVSHISDLIKYKATQNLPPSRMQTFHIIFIESPPCYPIQMLSPRSCHSFTYPPKRDFTFLYRNPQT